MSSFLIKKNDDEIDLVKLELTKEGYKFKPNMGGFNNIDKITLYDSSMIDIILSKKMDKAFKRVAAITYDVLASDDDNSTSDTIMALDEISKLRNIILNKYQKFLEKEIEKMYLKKLRVLENELRAKIIIQKEYNKQNKTFEFEEIEEKKGRGR